MAVTRTNRISLYRLRDPALFNNLDLRPKGYVVEHESTDTKLFVQPSRRTAPAWLQYIAPLLSSDPDDIRNETTSFVLLKRRAQHVYAIAGGYGFNEIRDSSVDDFGLQLALRMIDESGIANIKQRSLKGSVRQIMRAVAGYDPLFDADNYNRILDGLEGKVSFEGRQFRVSGRSSLVLRTQRSVGELDQVLSEIESVLQRDARINFPKSYEQVLDEATSGRLDAALEDEVKAFWRGETERDNIYLEFSDPLAQFRCDRFTIKYDRRSVDVDEFDLEVIRDALIAKGAKEPSSLEALSKFRVTGTNEFNIEEFKNTPFSNLVVYETSLDRRHYIRFGNKWYVILDDVQAYLDEELAKVTVDPDLLPGWNKAEFRTENSYNNWVAERNGWRCLDADLVHLQNRSKIEACDLYDPGTKRFIHVKETWGSKSAYLFSQGVTAAEFFNNSQEFREKCETKWPGLFPLPSDDITVVFGIADNKANDEQFPLNLTYFGKLSCYNAISRLRALGFNVILAPITLT